MPRKIDLIREVYDRQLGILTDTLEQWCGFLKTAAFQYKYPFSDQVLIFAQRPNATACAELEMWNKTFDRWVNRNAKGIALIQDKGTYTGIRYVFDVADTHGRHGEQLNLWKLKDEYKDDVLDSLENRFGEIEDTNEFYLAVDSACRNAVQDNMTDYMTDLLSLTENSQLEGLDEDNIRVRLQMLLGASVAYTVLTRLGANADMCIACNRISR